MFCIEAMKTCEIQYYYMGALVDFKKSKINSDAIFQILQIF